MKKWTLIALVTAAIVSGCSTQNTQKPALLKSDNAKGKELFERHCAMCHVTSKPKDRSKLIAPPIMGVMWHVKERYPNKADAVRFIVDYVRNPSHSKALCPSVKRFGLMPPLHLPEKDLEMIASYLYDNFPPQGFKHPKMGKGMMGR